MTLTTAIKLTLTALTLVLCTDAKCSPETLAVYEVQLDTFWHRKDFPKHYPEWRPPASWSKMLGFSHDTSFEVFRKGEAASPPLKLFVEKADSTLFDLYSQGSSGIFDFFSLPPISSGVGSSKGTMMIDANHTKVSMVTKIMPSPDWFIGVDTYDLCPSGRWEDYVHLEVGPLDAGTDKGLTFTSPNWPSEPQEKIQPITAHYPSHPAGSFYYPEIDELPILAQFILTKRKEYKVKDGFDAADHTITNDVPDTENAKYKYDLEDNNLKLENTIIESLIDTSPNTLKNQVDVPSTRRRWPYYKRRYGPYRPYSHNNRLKHKYWRNRIKHNLAKKTTIQPDQLEVTEPGLIQKTTPFPLSPPSWGDDSNRTRTILGRRGRKRIASGSAMAVIDDIVKDYQKEHRRKIRKRRREERKRRREQMKKIKPPRDCRVSEWMEWSACSKSCGIGEQTRKRKIIKHARRGGKPCPILVETTWCGSARACPRDYFKWR